MHDVLFGSIAQQIVAQGTTPVLLIRPGGAAFKLDTILLPLDPDSMHDDGLPLSQALAKAFGSHLVLLSVVPTFSTLAGEQAAAGSLMPGTTQAMLDIREETARAHLKDHVEALQADGILCISGGRTRESSPDDQQGRGPS